MEGYVRYHLNLHGDSQDIITAIDTLYEHCNDNHAHSSNPVSELITPEWYYSESLQILGDTPINWNNLGELEISKIMADNLEKAAIPDAIVGAEFERSFCSWYQPYHYMPRQKWGVHLRYHSWLRVASLFYRNCPSTMGKKLDSIKSAFLYLYAHELFHNIVENAASVMEILLGQPQLYTKYYSEIYSDVFDSSRCIEEALSNEYLLLWAQECHINTDFLKDQLLKQGPGYSDFIEYEGINFSKGNRILLSQIRYSSLKSLAYAPIEQLIDIPNPFRYSATYNIPIWLHHTAKHVY